MLQTIILAGVFASVGLGCFALLRIFMPTAAGQRVEALADGPAPAARHLPPAVERWLHPLAGLSLPEGGWEKSPLRIRFYNAGLRADWAPLAYFAAKTALTFLLPGLLLLALWAVGIELNAASLLAAVLLCAATGYYLPNAVLAHMVQRRQRELFEAFPDALDLMRVCVEAGLGLDAAIERVGREMVLESPALAEEFHLASLELRAGASRSDALRNLALRVALDDIDAMAAMLVQADRFGTSIAESLRVHAESLRTKRRLIAEEKAAKLPVKLLVPLVFCIFPSLLTVLLGPAAIGVYRNFIVRIAGG